MVICTENLDISMGYRPKYSSDLDTKGMHLHAIGMSRAQVLISTIIIDIAAADQPNKRTVSPVSTPPSGLRRAVSSFESMLSLDGNMMTIREGSLMARS